MTVDLIVARTFLSDTEAEIARSALDAAGIDSLIRRDDCGRMRPSLWLTGVELLVREHDLEAAREILDQPVVLVLPR